MIWGGWNSSSALAGEAQPGLTIIRAPGTRVAHPHGAANQRRTKLVAWEMIRGANNQESFSCSCSVVYNGGLMKVSQCANGITGV